jgi:hypothetical protein
MLLDELLGKLDTLSPVDRAKLIEEVTSATNDLKWVPNPGAQTQAYFCQADLTLYGGSGGGGKSSLLIGLALTAHERSLIMRREYTQLNALTDETLRLYGSRDGFSGSPPPKLRIPPSKKFPAGQLIEFGAAKDVGDEEWAQGQPHDFLGFDEAVHFAESQIRFLMGWVRSATPNQRCRTVLATNPPVRAEGQWVISMFRPWLDPTHSKPAKPGELRWFVTDPDGRDMEVDSSLPITLNGQTYIPTSRTFIPAKLKDNPFYANTNYQASLDALREPLRSAIRDGNFMAARVDAPDQLIPTAWIRQAQDRWQGNPPKGIPMCSIGVDVAQGGEDNTTLAIRHDGWFAPLIQVPGRETPGGNEVAALVLQHRRDGAEVIIDMGGGYGGAAKEHLEANRIHVVPFKGTHKPTSTSRNDGLKFKNARTQAYWRLREALDPTQRGGSSIALPDDPELVSDLTAIHFTTERGPIEITTKEDVVDLLGRSPDKGDAVAYAWFGGPRGLGAPADWAKHMTTGDYKRHPQVIRSVRGRR